MTTPLTFAHIGDLHLTGAEAENTRDFAAIVAQLGEVDGLDFVFVPGDNADNGRPEQYALLRAGLDQLRLPIHVITGDHDMEGGGLDAFYAGLGGPRLPYAVDVQGVRCLFLDMCGPGTGGPDFRLGPDQVAWLAAELEGADGRDCVLFMHSYPADLKGDGEAARVADLVHRGPVRLVEMGHTHYNELANDGRTIYAAARSTGQIEEGPVGYAVAALDGGVVSWRFKELSRPWPFVLITAPADRRLAVDAGHAIGARVSLRALVVGPAERVEFRIDEGAWQAMAREDGARCYAAEIAWPAGARTIAVRATGRGAEDSDAIEPATDRNALPTSRGIGSDADALEAWPGRGLLGTQLGPNRNGRQW
ncbi:metallophosphoesterase [Methylobacterium frigidaeris]|uniref:3',5'-cyclic adenosine monophosphate phosphodiesterase CpdA n=1 Tax=Methylobacterium frigidaeris TaxID=2038277 RepID=A0AA37HDR4_9HYPH|nr:metallophosphoesterase [Methylobacterium frigidaeris]PIK69477.1 metallophosphoesterase [Methylobacterium frigidaeris]GJD64055.1 3',5'-cyclic adenosine monophosphate phosphodiesterase CpdA [Methylobacterium frigidaeris]